jgi:predicted nuclease of predicted toxin-antitoxin system
VSPLADWPQRLRFDENLAARLVPALADMYPGSAYVGDVGLLGASDLAIWQYARENELVLVSKDEDFHRYSVLFGPPPKVIWIGLGNCSTADAIRLLRGRRGEIEAFLQHDEAGFLALA